MIHHISIAAREPLHVSQVLAEIMQGRSMPFPGHPGSYLALAWDDNGTMIEVLPLGTVLIPGGGIIEQNSVHNNYTAHHAAISVPSDKAQIQAIADRENWQMFHCSRQDYFEVIELWIENQLLVELLPADLSAKYLAFMSPAALEQFVRTLAAQANPV